MKKLESKNMELVSIIMAVYNGEKFLCKAIDSVIAQTYKNWELILIDDGSIDSTTDIILNYANIDARIRPVIKENTGLTLSLNLGVKKARGSFIARLDADDIWDTRKLEKQMYLLNNSSMGICGCAFDEIDENDKFLSCQRTVFCAKPNDIKKNIVKFNPFFHSSVLIRKSVIDEVGGYNPGFRYAQDYELWVRILKNYDGTNIDEVLAHRRYTKGMISKTKEKEQRKFALMAKSLAISLYGLPVTSYRYLINDIAIIILPKGVIDFARKCKYFQMRKN